jgi:ribonucleoside-diphosphate reductase alpha chain
VQQDLLATTAEQPVLPIVQQRTAAAPAEAGNAQPQYQFDRAMDGGAYMGTCPDCGSQLEFAEGCAKCHVCGFSECG